MNENKIVRHLLREVSRAARFLLDKGVNLTHCLQPAATDLLYSKEA